jgi:hypothetical protein
MRRPIRGGGRIDRNSGGSGKDGGNDSKDGGCDGKRGGNVKDSRDSGSNIDGGGSRY